MITPENIYRYIKRMRRMLRWAYRSWDRELYFSILRELPFWKRALRRELRDR